MTFIWFLVLILWATFGPQNSIPPLALLLLIPFAVHDLVEYLDRQAYYYRIPNEKGGDE